MPISGSIWVRPSANASAGSSSHWTVGRRDLSVRLIGHLRCARLSSPIHPRDRSGACIEHVVFVAAVEHRDRVKARVGDNSAASAALAVNGVPVPDWMRQDQDSIVVNQIQ
jgi:hypothetical protein